MERLCFAVKGYRVVAMTRGVTCPLEFRMEVFRRTDESPFHEAHIKTSTAFFANRAEYFCNYKSLLSRLREHVSYKKHFRGTITVHRHLKYPAASINSSLVSLFSFAICSAGFSAGDNVESIATCIHANAPNVFDVCAGTDGTVSNATQRLPVQCRLIFAIFPTHSLIFHTKKEYAF